MLAALAAAEPMVQATFAEASDVLGYDLWALCQNGPEEQLSATEFTQPAMLTAGVATWRVWCAKGGPMPSAMAGHSLGEYSALVCTGALDFVTAVELVQFRGRAMQQAVPAGQGAMAAILGVDDVEVAKACDEAAQGDIVQPANFNSPAQIVIAGSAAAVDRAIELLKARGAKRAIKLPVSAPSHSPLMKPAAEQLQARLQQIDFAAEGLARVYNCHVQKHTTADAARAALTDQLTAPVRWTQTISAMVAEGARVVVECGPGKVLTGLNRRIEKNREITMLAIEDSASLAQALETCRSAA